MPNSMEILDFINKNESHTLDTISKQYELAQKQKYLQSAQNYAVDPSAQNLQQIGLMNPAAANAMMAIKKQQVEEKARSVRSAYNTWQSVPPSKKSEFFTELRKKFPDEMRFYPLEYDEKTSGEINAMLNADNMTAMGLLGEDAQSKIGQIRADVKRGLVSEDEAKMAINKERNGDTPSAIKEYTFYNKLSPAEQQRYLDVKRDTKGIVINADGSVAPKTNYVETKEAIKAGEARGSAGGKIEGEDKANARVNLSKAEDQASYSIKLLDDLVKHPGLKDVVGAKNVLSGAAPMIIGKGPIAGTKAADFMARFEQIQGTKFLEAYQTLKGGGSITEGEGTKATQAISRIKTAQSEKEFLSAVKELKDIVNKGLKREKEKAKGGSSNNATSTNNRPSLDSIFGVE